MKSNIYDRRRVQLSKILEPGHIPFLAGRPEREKVINQNDFLDLKIALNTSNSLDELISIL